MSKRTWSKSEELAAIDLMIGEGTLIASRKFGVSQKSLYKWRDCFEEKGDHALQLSQE